MNTHSKVQFRGYISRSFEIKTGVQQGDQALVIKFHSLLEKMIREWMETKLMRELFQV